MWQAFELRLWPHQHPLRQFEGILAQELLFKMEDRGLWMERLQVVLQSCMCKSLHCRQLQVQRLKHKLVCVC